MLLNEKEKKNNKDLHISFNKDKTRLQKKYNALF